MEIPYGAFACTVLPYMLYCAVLLCFAPAWVQKCVVTGMARPAAQLEDVLSWRCGHPGHARPMAGVQAGATSAAAAAAAAADEGSASSEGPGEANIGAAAAGRGDPGDRDMPDLHLDAIASLERAGERYSAFGNEEEDDDELRSIYLVRAVQITTQTGLWARGQVRRCRHRAPWEPECHARVLDCLPACSYSGTYIDMEGTPLLERYA